MSDQKKAAQGSAAAAPKAAAFKHMSLSQKCLHLLKAAVFLATFGFAFPTIFEDF